MLTTDDYYEESYGWMFREDSPERHFETFNDEMDYIDFRM